MWRHKWHYRSGRRKYSREAVMSVCPSSLQTEQQRSWQGFLRVDTTRSKMAAKWPGSTHCLKCIKNCLTLRTRKVLVIVMLVTRSILDICSWTTVAGETVPRICGGDRRRDWMKIHQYWMKSCETEKWLMLDKDFEMRRYLNTIDQEWLRNKEGDKAARSWTQRPLNLCLGLRDTAPQ